MSTLFNQVADEIVTDRDYQPLPVEPTYTLFVRDEDGSAVKWSQGPVREDLLKLAPTGAFSWVVTNAK
mgnify:CR=1 FL=1